MNKRYLFFWLTIICLAFIPNLTSNAKKDNRAGLAVEYGDGSVESYCISFDADSLSGIELLVRSGLDMQANYSPLGAAVCKIGNEGCPADDSCLKCQAPLFWSYWQLTDNEWVYSAQGASISEVRDGDVDAWVWGYGAEPQPASFGEICAQSGAPTSISTSTNTSLPTPTLQATDTLIPTYTSVPTLAKAITNTLIPTYTSVPTLAEAITNTPIPYFTSTANPNPSDTAVITPIIVRNIPSEQNQPGPQKANLPPKKAVSDDAAFQELIQPTPTPHPSNDSMIGSVISGILKTVRSLVNVLLP